MRLLDLFCGAGGATEGYKRAGFHVTGVDIKPQPRYCGDVFVQADAMEYPLAGYDAIHASPPCQSYSIALRHLALPQPMLISAMKARLVESGAHWVIENVPGAPIPGAPTLFGEFGVTLCGTSFGLAVYRHRLFETSFRVPSLPCCHRKHAMNPHRAEGRERMYAEYGRGDPEIRWAEEMGVAWMNRHEAREAIPPVYTEYIGHRLMEVDREMS